MPIPPSPTGILRRSLLAGGAASALASPLAAAPSVLGAARPADTLRFVPASALGALDPIWSTDPVVQIHACYVYDTLYGTDAQSRPRPQMAIGHEVSEDGRTWRIRLRDDLWFHDGTPVRAADCVTSLTRWAQRSAFGQLLGSVLESQVAADDRTIELRLTRAFPLVLDALGCDDDPLRIMPERLAVTPVTKPVTEAIGSGPYRFVAAEYDSGNRAVYERWDRYVPRSEPVECTAGGKVANYRRIEWHVMPDPATAAAALAVGEVDWWQTVPADLQPVLAGRPGIVLARAKQLGALASMRFNCVQPPFDNPAIRAAVRLAVDQTDFMQAAFGAAPGSWAVCKSLWPIGTPYHTDADAPMMPGDRSAARAALSAAGYGGERVAILSSADRPMESALGNVTADLLRSIGMTVDLQTMDYATMIKRRQSKAAVDRGGWSIFHSATMSASHNATPATSLYCRAQGRQGWNGWWQNAEVEALATGWAFADDDAERQRTAARIGHIAMSEAATIPLGQCSERTAYRTTVTGILPCERPYPWNVRPA